MNKIDWWRTSFNHDEVSLLKQAVKSECISQGKVTEKFEKEFAKRLKVKYAVATTSGSASLLLALKTLGIGPGDEVIVPNRTWIATANAVVMAGAHVKLVDVERKRPVIDVEAIIKNIGPKTKAIIPVHINGRSASMRVINRLAQEYNLHVIEDACQAFYSKNEQGFLGTQSSVGCFSLAVGKIISTGQGGVCITNDKSIYTALKLFKNNGLINPLTDQWGGFGFNFKFNDLLASFGLAQLKQVKEREVHLKKIYQLYKQGLRNLDYMHLSPVNLSAGELPLYIEVLARKRHDVSEYLLKHNIKTRKFYPCLDSSGLFCSKKNNGTFQNSKPYEHQGLYLPCGPEQPLKNIKRVIRVLKKYPN